jgi:tRNA modification GTPase
LSGKNAIEITEKVFLGKKLSAQPSHTLHFGKIMNGPTEVDEVVVGIFKAPNSYTKEDVIEISSHGSPFIVQKIMEQLIHHGARGARAGEFTMRAFLNGRFDLSQAEAVADLIAADSQAAHQAAINQMRGGFSIEIKTMREKLIHFAALIELELDFSEEDVEFASRQQLKKLLQQLIAHISALKNTFQLGNAIKNGMATVIAGRPNAGKSTLLNALLNEERAIVSEIPGTTRDTIEEVIHLNGIAFRLIDTAGIREARDVIEKIGVEKTMEKIRQSSIVLYLFDVNELDKKQLLTDINSLHLQQIPSIIVGNKIDERSQENFNEKFNGVSNLIFISAKEKIHLDDLKRKLAEMAMNGEPISDQAIVLNVRHFEALQRAEESLHDALKALDEKISGELVASDLRRALNALGEITGEVTNDEILGSIFSKFCIGK